MTKAGAARRSEQKGDDRGLFIHRELSWLAFNDRVLAMASDPSVPLLERLRFLTISSTNLDEFVEIRVAGLHEQRAWGVGRSGPDGLSPAESLARIGAHMRRQVEEQYRVLNEELLPALEAEGIRLLRRSAWTGRQRRWVLRFFEEQVLPVLTPLGLDPAHPFPMVLNKGLNFIVTLEGEDAFGRNGEVAVLQVPRCLPRIIPVPDEVAGAPYDFVLLSSVVHAHVDRIFPGMTVQGCHQFRVTRNSDLWVDEEEVGDLLTALKGELPGRRYGQAVRLEVAANCPESEARFLLRRFGLAEGDLVRVDGPVNLHRLAALYDLVDRPDLKYPPFLPRVPRRLRNAADPFAVIRRGDVVLHHPYESFTPVVDLVRRAAADPSVLAIKQTLYRTGSDSPIADALVEAAQVGKEVTVVVELRARFDEAANIELATRLQEVGANVVYGVVGFKTHCKMLLIVRREGEGLRRYVHLGTGNYHPGTARIYTDIGLLTASKRVGEDVHRIFQQLTGFGRRARLSRLRQAPFELKKLVLDRLRKAAKAARKGRPARVVARMNALSEPEVIRAIYDASRAGVEIDLIVRGICRLRPGVPGVSETVRVRSIVGRFLEHSRVYWFDIDGERELWCSSADWMTRNLERRVEVAWPVEDRRLRERIYEEALGVCLRDDIQAWELGPDGEWRRLRPPEGAAPFSAQEALMARVGGAGA